MLDDAIGASELLMSVAPIRFITVGGMLAISVLGNRESTKDVDFLLDPNVEAVPEYRVEVLRAIDLVASRAGLDADWMNDDVRIFIRSSRRLRLFLESVHQDVLVYAGRNLTIYAGCMEFALERKLRRLGESTGRERAPDLSDAVALVHWLKGAGRPLDWQSLKGLDVNNLDMPVSEAALGLVARTYESQHRAQGIVGMARGGNDHHCGRLNTQSDWVHV